jgi:succinyldiaminopimelate transaminase
MASYLGRSSIVASSRLRQTSWDNLNSFRRQAAGHPEGIVNLSVGNPVDPVPAVVRAGLAAGEDSHAYAPTRGTPALREAVADWLRRHTAAPIRPEMVLPVIGAKEFLTSLPMLLGLGGDDRMVVPKLAYPPYFVGSVLSGAGVIVADDVDRLPTDGSVRIVYLNSPHNPTGRIMPAAELKAFVTWVRCHDALLVSDECYSEFTWTGCALSVLSPDVCGGTFQNLVAVNSLSKRSNMAGYRAGFVGGDPEFISEIAEIRQQIGMTVSGPVQAAMTAALRDQEHVAIQRAVYGRRRQVLMAALASAGWELEPCEAGLYIWAKLPGLRADEATSHLAERGVLVVPGTLYGAEGREHVRISLTAPDERIDEAVRRIGG